MNLKTLSSLRMRVPYRIGNIWNKLGTKYARNFQIINTGTLAKRKNKYKLTDKEGNFQLA